MKARTERRANHYELWWVRFLPPRVRAICRVEVAVTGIIACFFMLFYLVNLVYDFDSMVREVVSYVRFAGAVFVVLLVCIKGDRFPLWVGYAGALLELTAFVVYIGFGNDHEQIAFRLQEFPLIALYLAWLFPTRMVRATIYPVLAFTLIASALYGHVASYEHQGSLLSILSLLLLTMSGIFIGDYVKRRFAQQIEIDELTGALSRRGLSLRGEALFVSCRRHHRPFSVALLDMDGFKQINDLGGHDAGDHALKALVRFLREATRDGDLVSRLGGDEFVVVFPNTTRCNAQITMERIQRSAPYEWSFGVAEARPDDNLSTLILRADRDMYSSKRDRASREGRNPGDIEAK